MGWGGVGWGGVGVGSHDGAGCRDEWQPGRALGQQGRRAARGVGAARGAGETSAYLASEEVVHFFGDILREHGPAARHALVSPRAKGIGVVDGGAHGGGARQAQAQGQDEGAGHSFGGLGGLRRRSGVEGRACLHGGEGQGQGGVSGGVCGTQPERGGAGYHQKEAREAVGLGNACRIQWVHARPRKA